MLLVTGGWPTCWYRTHGTSALRQRSAKIMSEQRLVARRKRGRRPSQLARLCPTRPDLISYTALTITTAQDESFGTAEVPSGRR
jgi:hypothetical protein